MKKCTKCKKEKELNKFNEDKNRKDGYKCWCKKCMNIGSKKYRAKNRQRNERLGIVIKTKYCSKCKQYKTAEDFNKSAHRKDGLDNICRECDKKYKKERHRLNPQIQRKNRLKHNYGITIRQYEKMLKQQEGCCAICKSKNIETNRHQHFAVDHDHKTGKIRALLCTKCNAMLGIARDNPETLRQAAQYLESHNLESYTQYSMTHPSVGFEEVC